MVSPRRPAVRILEEHVVNQIAAGEVVERPASVVRELLQNALDAGARTVEVRLRGGGLEALRVTDDGHGMGRDDAMMCLERHATSKILRAEDLQSVETLGFRGEALPSIAAVSRFELRTRPHDEDEGTRVRVEGGTLRDVGPVGCPPGTQVDVRSLFYNLPARRKFLRAPATELAHATAAVAREVLIRPDLDAIVRHEDRDVLRAPRVANPADRLAAVLGEEARALLPLDQVGSGLRVWGFVAPIGLHRSTAAGSVFLYVNDRYVADPLLRRAVNEAYRDRVPRGRYPLVVLRVDVAPGAVDVNVHPTKTEVRFSEPHAVADLVTRAIRERVVAVSPGPLHRPPTSTHAGPGPLFGHSAPEAPPPAPVRPLPERAPVPAHPDDDPQLAARLRELPPRPDLVAEPPPPELRSNEAEGPDRRWRELVVLGPLGPRRQVASLGESLVVVDVYEARRALCVRRAAAGEPPMGPAQRLLAPVRLAVGVAVAARLEAAAETLSGLGVELDRFASGEVAVRALPRGLGPIGIAELVDAAAVAVDRGPQAVVELVCSIGARHGGPLDPVGAKTLFATLDEAGVPFAAPVVLVFGPDELLRRSAAAP